MNPVQLAEKIRILEDIIGRGKRAQKIVRAYITAFQKMPGRKKSNWHQNLRFRSILHDRRFPDLMAKLWKMSV